MQMYISHTTGTPHTVNKIKSTIKKEIKIDTYAPLEVLLIIHAEFRRVHIT